MGVLRVLCALPVALLCLLSAAWLLVHFIDQEPLRARSVPAAATDAWTKAEATAATTAWTNSDGADGDGGGGGLGSRLLRRLAASDWSAFHDHRFHHHSFAHSTDDVFFEGVYFKLVGPSSSRTISGTDGSSDGEDIVVVIPGVLLNRVNASASEAFLSVVHNARVNYYRFPVEEFEATPLTRAGTGQSDNSDDTGSDRSGAGAFRLRIGRSVFTERGMQIDVTPDADDDARDSVHADITFESMTPWTTRLFHPSTMGVLGWLSGLECYHHVLSLHHRLRGFIRFEHLEATSAAAGAGAAAAASSSSSSSSSHTLSLDGGIGYSEKDWGSSFPDTWVWAQSNHFQEDTAQRIQAQTPEGKNADRDVPASVAKVTKALGDSNPQQPIPVAAADIADPPTALFLSIARVPLPPVAAWVAGMLGWSSPDALEELRAASAASDTAAKDSTASGNSSTALPLPASAFGFVVGFLLREEVHIFSSYQMDSLHRFEVRGRNEVEAGRGAAAAAAAAATATDTAGVGAAAPSSSSAADDALHQRADDSNKEMVLLSFVDAARTRMLEVELHKPVQTDVALEIAAMRQRDEVARAAAAAHATASSSIPTPSSAASHASATTSRSSSVVAGLYGPRGGRMEKYVKEALLGGHMLVRFWALASAEHVDALDKEQRAAGAVDALPPSSSSSSSLSSSSLLQRAGAWSSSSFLVGGDPMHSSLLYSSVARPAAMEVQGDVKWLAREAAHVDQRVMRGVLRWIVQPYHAAIVAASILSTVVGAIVWHCISHNAKRASISAPVTPMRSPAPSVITLGDLHRQQQVRQQQPQQQQLQQQQQPNEQATVASGNGHQNGRNGSNGHSTPASLSKRATARTVSATSNGS